MNNEQESRPEDTSSLEVEDDQTTMTTKNQTAPLLDSNNVDKKVEIRQASVAEGQHDSTIVGKSQSTNEQKIDQMSIDQSQASPAMMPGQPQSCMTKNTPQTVLEPANEQIIGMIGETPIVRFKGEQVVHKKKGRFNILQKPLASTEQPRPDLSVSSSIAGMGINETETVILPKADQSQGITDIGSGRRNLDEITSGLSNENDSHVDRTSRKLESSNAKNTVGQLTSSQVTLQQPLQQELKPVDQLQLKSISNNAQQPVVTQAGEGQLSSLQPALQQSVAQHAHLHSVSNNVGERQQLLQKPPNPTEQVEPVVAQEQKMRPSVSVQQVKLQSIENNRQQCEQVQLGQYNSWQVTQQQPALLMKDFTPSDSLQQVQLQSVSNNLQQSQQGLLAQQLQQSNYKLTQPPLVELTNSNPSAIGIIALGNVMSDRIAMPSPSHRPTTSSQPNKQDRAGLGKLIGFLDQMQLEVSEAERLLHELQEENQSLKLRNRELQARNRTLEAMLDEEKILRETTEARLQLWKHGVSSNEVEIPIPATGGSQQNEIESIGHGQEMEGRMKNTYVSQTSTPGTSATEPESESNSFMHNFISNQSSLNSRSSLHRGGSWSEQKIELVMKDPTDLSISRMSQNVPDNTNGANAYSFQVSTPNTQAVSIVDYSLFSLFKVDADAAASNQPQLSTLSAPRQQDNTKLSLLAKNKSLNSLQNEKLVNSSQHQQAAAMQTSHNHEKVLNASETMEFPQQQGSDGVFVSPTMQNDLSEDKLATASRVEVANASKRYNIHVEENKAIDNIASSIQTQMNAGNDVQNSEFQGLDRPSNRRVIMSDSRFSEKQPQGISSSSEPLI